MSNGLVTVNFDAGGLTGVSINPVIPVRVEPEKGKESTKGDARWRIFWTLDDTNTNPAYVVRFGNICRLDKRALGEKNFVSRLDSEQPQAWIWEFDYNEDEPTKEVAYDIFLLYGLRDDLLGQAEHDRDGLNGRARDVRFVSVRELITVDPTLLIPPP